MAELGIYSSIQGTIAMGFEAKHGDTCQAFIDRIRQTDSGPVLVRELRTFQYDGMAHAWRDLHSGEIHPCTD